MAAGGKNAHNRGIPGYPVPPEMRPVPQAEANQQHLQNLSHDYREQITQAVSENAHLLKKRGIPVDEKMSIIGAGSNGIAYAVGDRVLKVTKDQSEANASARIRGKNYKNLVKVFDVFRFPSKEGEDDTFGIYQEKLEPFSAADQEEFSGVIADVEIDSNLFSSIWSEGDWDTIYRLAIESAEDDADATVGSVARVRNGLDLLRDKYQVDKIVDQLKAARIEFTDFHGGNIMKRGGDVVLIDLGISNSPPVKINVLERLVRKRMSEGPPPLPNHLRPDSQKNSTDWKKIRGVSDKDADFWIKKDAEKLKKRGVRPKSVIATGSRGVAYDIGHNQVFKVTNDQEEARAANKVKGLKLKHVVRVFDVFRFPEGKLWGIVQEKLKPLSGAEGNPRDKVAGEAGELNWAVSTLLFQYCLSDAGYDWEKTKAMMNQYIKTKVVGLSQQDAIETAQRANQAYATLLKFQIDKMVKELNSVGIKFHDYHAGNMMKRGGDYVIIDLGYSEVDGAQEPDVLEKRIREDFSDHQQNSDQAMRNQNRQLLNTNRDRIIKRGFDVPDMPKALGQGTKGTAYDIGNGLVLKITEDKSEAWSSNKIKKKKLKNVVYIHDVFQFPGTESFGIVEEKLEPLSEKEKSEIGFLVLDMPAAVFNGNFDPEQTLQNMLKHHFNNKGEFLKGVEHFQLMDMVKQLDDVGVYFRDYHAGNIMKRGSDYVVIDLGYSNSPGAQAPDVLERMIRELAMNNEPVDFAPVNHNDDGTIEKAGRGEDLDEGGSKADTVALVFGKFQTFHRGYAAMTRRLTQKYTKVILVFQESQPLPYEALVSIAKLALVDVEPKIETYRSEWKQNPSDYVPGVISDIIKDHASSVEANVAVNIYVFPDRKDEVEAQVRASEAEAEESDLYFRGDLAVVHSIARARSENNVEGVDTQAAVKALTAEDKETFKSFMDPHVLSDPENYDDLWEELMHSLGHGDEVQHESVALDEELKDIGGSKGAAQILELNAKPLKVNKSLDVHGAKYVGSGDWGAVFGMTRGDVIKVTTDAEEAKTAYHIRGKGGQHVVKISDCFRFRRVGTATVPIFGVVEEKLTKLSDEEKSKFKELRVWIRDDNIINHLAQKTSKEVLEQIRQLVNKDVREELGLPPMTPGQQPQPSKREARAQALADQRYNEIYQMMVHFNVDKMIDELREMGVQFADYHGDNIMKRGSDYVIADLSKSKSPGEDPPWLETEEQFQQDQQAPAQNQQQPQAQVQAPLTNAVVREAGGFGTAGAGDFGGAHTGLRAGSSGWSSPRNKITDADVDSDGEYVTWQERIPDPNLKMRGKAKPPR